MAVDGVIVKRISAARALDYFSLDWEQPDFINIFTKTKSPNHLSELHDLAKIGCIEVFCIEDDRVITYPEWQIDKIDAPKVKQAFKFMLIGAICEINRRRDKLPWRILKGQIEEIMEIVMEESLAKYPRDTEDEIPNQQTKTEEVKEKRQAAKQPDEVDGFIAPKRVKRAPSPQVTEPVTTSNNFEVLTEVMPEEVEMTETVEQSKKIPRPPPIVMEYEGNVLELVKQIACINGTEPTVRCYGKQITMRAEDMGKHEAIKTLLLNQGIKFHSFTPKGAKPTKIIIKGLPISMEPKELQELLQKSEFRTAAVNRLYKPSNEKPPPPFVVTLMDEMGCERLLSCKKLAIYLIKVEKLRRRKKTILVCYKCQMTGHTTHNCYRDVACRSCGANHETKSCSSSSICCARCKGQHKATDPSCPLLKKRENPPRTEPKEKQHARARTQEKITPPPPGGITYAQVAAGTANTKPAAEGNFGPAPFDEMLPRFAPEKVSAFLAAYDRFKTPPPDVDQWTLRLDAIAALLRLSVP